MEILGGGGGWSFRLISSWSGEPSLRSAEPRQAVFRERFDRAPAILLKRVLLCRKKELLAAPRSSRIQTQDASHERICFSDQLLGRADLGN
jgi:hypothetical protein